MIIKDIIKDIFDTDCQVIVHQVNCMGKMRSGMAKEIKERFPEVYESYIDTYLTLGSFTLGGCSLVKLNSTRGNLSHVANLYGQYAYIGSHSESELMNLPMWNSPDFFNGDEYEYTTTPRFTNYEALTRGLEKLRYDMISLGLTSLAVPFRLGSDRGKGDWNVVRSIIESVFSGSDITIKIHHKPINPTV